MYESEEIEEEVIGYFQNIFSTSWQAEMAREAVQIPAKVSLAVSNDLLRSFSELEVKKKHFFR